MLNLTLADYKQYVDELTQGFIEAEKILQEERIFVSRDLPYSTQLIPLTVLCTILAENNKIKVTNIKDKIKIKLIIFFINFRIFLYFAEIININIQLRRFS